MDGWGDFSRTWVRRVTRLAVSRPADLARLRRVNRFFLVESRCHPDVHARRCKELLEAWNTGLRAAAGLGPDTWVARFDPSGASWRTVPPPGGSTRRRMLHDMEAWVTAARDKALGDGVLGEPTVRGRRVLQMASRVHGACRDARCLKTWWGRLRVLVRADREIRRNCFPRRTLSGRP